MENKQFTEIPPQARHYFIDEGGDSLSFLAEERCLSVQKEVPVFSTRLAGGIRANRAPALFRRSADRVGERHLFQRRAIIETEHAKSIMAYAIRKTDYSPPQP